MEAELLHLPQMLVHYRMNGYAFLMFKRYQVEQDSNSRINSWEPNGLTNKHSFLLLPKAIFIFCAGSLQDFWHVSQIICGSIGYVNFWQNIHKQK